MDIDKNSAECLVPALIIQPIVENAIFHGIEASGWDGLIVVESSITDNCLVIVISDNGQGILPRQLEQLKKQLQESKDSKSIGLLNVMNRIRVNFGWEYGLDIDSEYGIGTTVTLRLPIIYQKKGGEQVENIDC